ncbi:NADH-quinone oxidoreductase subunit L [Natranaeroarchaeum aerophilus]|uniref:NADH-quinone oxidoreductase subunit L n=1 Tax=Natranaeroarchaeum aerophilus TaxID=2917711 RepID=A0AAE3FT51_9EURY|nr:NADH-quinone oxidoreductase subunit L [Natranaeroarchaeum aerophilus]MCL9815107.1 NADH-quinone oxidoreductase subunit L [Natranaeroarchaeum aerophilus]
MAIFELSPAIALLPFVSFLLALTAGKYMPKRGAIGGIVATGGSLLLSIWAFIAVAGGQQHQETYWVWTDSAPVDLTFGILIDPLSSLMLVIVSLVAFLVHIFSLGYMNAEGETGLPRYYAELGLFTFSMLAFVYADNLLMAFMFFELVGLCSYLLIGFWFRTDSAASAAKKAFLVTRFGDYFFLIGVVGIIATFGTSQFVSAGGMESFVSVAEAGDFWTPGGLSESQWITGLALLVLGGVIGKSAQFPLHTWLPDAMEGPTTVSALIHAATMVAAGVYLVARMFGFYALSPTALGIIAFVGAFTALFAATMGCVKNDVKQVLAYSTISQYGYMMLGLGVGGYVAGVFHLMNHAFFKALLFLGAGAVIILMHHEQDMWKMGGLKDKAPVTYYTFLAGALALAGIIPFSGFWSKDEILYDAVILGLNEPVFLMAYAMGLTAVFFTGFYTFRMVFLTFHGEPRSEHAEDPHPVGWSVKVPLITLGGLATVAGVANLAPVEKLTGVGNATFLADWLNGGTDGSSVGGYEALTYDAYTAAADLDTTLIAESEQVTVLIAGALALGLALAGAGLAYYLYNVPRPEPHVENLGSVRDVLYSNYYLDEFQVALAERVTMPVARAANTFDQSVIDGVVNSSGSVSLFGGDRIRRVQTGVVTDYAAMLALALVLLLVGFGLHGGWLL